MMIMCSFFIIEVAMRPKGNSAGGIRSDEEGKEEEDQEEELEHEKLLHRSSLPTYY